MDYEIVTLPQKSVVGITARTRNGCESAGKVIGSLWRDFYGKGIFRSIEHKSNDCAVGDLFRLRNGRKGRIQRNGGLRSKRYAESAGGHRHKKYP